MELVVKNQELILSLVGMVAVDIVGYFIAKSEKTTSLSLGQYALELVKKIVKSIVKWVHS